MSNFAGLSPAQAPPGDAELARASRSGDAVAYATLSQRHLTAARSLARQLASRRAEADDLVAEAFAEVLDTLRRGDELNSAFRPYLLTAVRRVAENRRGAARGHVATDQNVIARAFASLPPRWQAVLWHTEIEGARPAEVALLLGLNATGAAVLAYRAREGLRQAYLQLYLSAELRGGCRPVAAGLGVYARGGLAGQDAAATAAHLDQCVDCRAVLSDLGDVKVSLRSSVAPLILGSATAGYLAAVSRSLRSEGSAGSAGSAAGWATSRRLWLRHAPKGQQAAAAGVAAAAVAVVIAAGLTATTLTAHPGAVADSAPAHQSLPSTAAAAPAAPPSSLDSMGGCGTLSKSRCGVSHPSDSSAAPPPPASQASPGASPAPYSQPTPGFSPSPPASSSTELTPKAPVLTTPVLTAPALTAPGVATPALTTPALTSPALTAPGLAAPALASPVLTAPGVTAPGLAAPGVTAPAPTASASTAPARALPTSTAPATRSPATTVPATTAPRPAVSPSSQAPRPVAVRPAQLAARIDLVGALPRGATGIVAFTVTNSSPRAAVRLEANVTLPPKVSYLAGGAHGRVTAAGPGGWSCTPSAHGASCSHGPLAAALSSTSYLPVAVAADAPADRAPAISVGDGGRLVRARGTAGVTAAGFPAQFAASGRYAVVTAGSRLAGVPLARIGSANLALPGRVVWAGLYWAWEAGPPQAAVELRGPGGRYQRVAETAAAVASLKVRGRPKVAVRQAFADVTGLVARYGAGSWRAAVSPVTGSASRGSRQGDAKPGSAKPGGAKRSASPRGRVGRGRAGRSRADAGYLGWTLVVVVADDTAPAGQVMVLGGVRQVDAANPHFSAPLGEPAAGRAVQVKAVRWTTDGPQASAFTHPPAHSPAISFTAGAMPYLVGVITATDSREPIRR